MSDITRDAAQGIWLRHTHPSHKTPERIHMAWEIQKAERPERVDDFLSMAEAAIAVAEPHLRRKHRQELLDELIAEAEDLAPLDEADYWLAYTAKWLRMKEGM